jgi:hypothetical protein
LHDFRKTVGLSQSQIAVSMMSVSVGCVEVQASCANKKRGAGLLPPLEGLAVNVS